jgi:hypothetical protein
VREVVQLFPSIAPFIHHQCGEVLHSIDRICDAELRVTATAITADCNEGGLRTQDRHEANGVSNVRAIRKRACLCGVVASSCLHSMIVRSQGQRRNGADALALSGREMQHVGRRRSRL